MYRSLLPLLLLLQLWVHPVSVAAMRPTVPCGVPVYTFGGSTILGEGVRQPGSNDFAARMDTFFGRVCAGDVAFTKVAEEGSRLVDDVDSISSRLLSSPRSVAFVHFPFSDIEDDVSIEQLLRAYRKIIDACKASASICIIGGQQPVNSFAQDVADRQLELERRATAAFGANYLPLFRYFRSESKLRRLMFAMDSGDGRLIGDLGHELLYQLYRRRLLEIYGTMRR